MKHTSLTLSLIALLILVGFGCQKPIPETTEEANARPFQELEGKELVIDLSEDEVTAGQEDGLILVAATKMGVAFSYDPEHHAIGSVGLDVNPDAVSPFETQDQFIGVMDRETLGEGEAPYGIVFKNFFLNGGSYTTIERTFDGEVLSVEDVQLDGVSGRKYRIAQEPGFHLVFPHGASSTLNIQVFDEGAWKRMESTVHLPEVR